MEELLDSYLGQSQDLWTRPPRLARKFKAVPYKTDGVLDARDIAKLNAKYQAIENSPENLSVPTVKTATEEYDEVARVFEREDVSLPQNLVASLNGNWSQKTAKDKLNYLSEKLEESVSRNLGAYGLDNLPTSLKDSFVRSLLSKALRNYNQNSHRYAEITNADTGDVIRAYVARLNSNKLLATPEDLRLAENALAAVRENTNLTKPVKLSILAASTKPVDDTGGPAGSSTLGFAVPGAGAHIVKPKIDSYAKDKLGRQPVEEYDPEQSWHSVPQKNYEEAFTHTAIHEIGHVVMFQYWGTDSAGNRGKESLESDYNKFKVSGQVVSKYGKKNTSEHFAEAYARYILTGDATPEFRDLLASKGLLKSQQEG